MDKMTTLPMKRRAVLTGGTSLALMAAAKPNAVRQHPIDVTSKASALKHLIRMLGHEGGGDVLFWFHGTIYGVLGDRRPMPLVHFNGVNAMRFTQLDDGSYQSRHHSISYMEDRHTHELLTSWTNPITGKIVTPEPNVFNGSIYNYSTKGTKMERGKWASATPLDPGMWTFSNETAWITIDRPFASFFGHPWAEARTYDAPLKDVINPKVKSLLVRQHSTVSNPFPKWMEMGNTEGLALWQANGAKLKGASQLPTHILERCRTYMPVLFDYDVFG